MKKNNLIIILGPTAVGKTKISVKIAKKLNSPIISCDSRQFYKELNIGTDKPNKQILKEIKHYFINSLSIKQNYNVGEFEKDTIKLLKQLFVNFNNLIMAGGSGLYINSICNGIDNMPAIDPLLRQKLNKKYKKSGIDYFKKFIKKNDPIFYNNVDLNNHQRLIRGVEVFLQTKQPFSSLRKGIKKKRNFNIIKIGIKESKEKLYNKINKRVDLMIKKGLISETKKLYKFKEYNALQTIGYKEIFMYLENSINLNECIELIKKNTRNYSKRQITWFNKEHDIKWFYNNEYEDIIKYIINETN